MVSSPYYERLMALKNLNVKPLDSGDYQEDSRTGNAHTAVTEVKGKGEDFQNDASRGQSQTKVGADGWMKRFVDDSNEHMNNIESSKAHHLALREAMNNRIAESSNLSESLLNSADYSAAQNDPLRLTVDGDGSVVYTDGPAYLAALEEQRNAKREAAAKAILDQLNQEGHKEAGSFDQYKEDYVPEAWQPQPTPEGGGGYGGGGYGMRSRRGGVGGAAVGGGGGVLSVGSSTGLPSGVTEWKAPAAGEPGSFSNPISDSEKLSHIDITTTPVNQRMTPNGPGSGHMPADVLNANDPAWRALPSTGGTAARIAGGALVTGTAAGVGGLAATHGGGGFSGIGGLAAGPSGSALRSVAPAGGVLRPSSMSGGAAGVVGRGGVGGAGMRSGMAPVGSSGSGTGGAGSRGGAGVVGRGGAGAAGRSGAGAGVAGRGGGAGRAGGGAGVVGRGGSGAGAAGSRGGASGVAGRSGAAASRGGAGVVGRGGSGAGAAGSRGGASGVAGRSGAAASRGGAGVVGRGGASGAGGRGGAGAVGRGGVSGVVGREGGAGSARGGASGVAGRGGAAASRGGAGVVGRGGASGAGVPGRGGAGGRGVLGRGSSAGRGEKKKETQRRNYDVVRIDGIEEQSKGLVGGAAGSADQLKPLSRDSGEDW